MSKAEEYLDSVAICPNEGFVDVTDALEAVRIVREEVIKKACEWLKIKFTDYEIATFEQAMEKGE